MKVKLKDGSIVDIHIDPDWDDEAKQRAIREYKAGAGADPAETDDWSTYLGKLGGSIARGGGAGLSSVVDFLGNSVAVAPRMIYNKATGQDLLHGFMGEGVRNAYEDTVPAQPRGSDYETTAKVSEVLAPAVVESLLTGSPKTAPFRAARDAGMGWAGGHAGEFVGDLYSEEAGDLLRKVGSAAAPYAVTRTAVRQLPVPKMVSRTATGIGLPDPTNLIPKTTPLSGIGGYGAGRELRSPADEERERRVQIARWRRMKGEQ